MSATSWHRQKVDELARLVTRSGELTKAADLLDLLLAEEWERGYQTGQADAERNRRSTA